MGVEDTFTSSPPGSPKSASCDFPEEVVDSPTRDALLLKQKSVPQQHDSVPETLDRPALEEAQGRSPTKKVLPQDVQTLQDEGRTLAALRLLALLESDADVSSAARIRAIGATVAEKVGMVNEVKAQADCSDSEWVHRAEPSVELYTRYDRWTGLAEAVGQLDFELPPLHLWALFREFDLAASWLPNCERSTVLHKFGEQAFLYQVESSPPVKVIAPTQGFQDRNYVDALDEHGCFCVVVNPIAVDASTYEGITLPPPPRGAKRVSGDIFNMVTPLSRGRTRLTMNMKLQTPFLFLPSFVVSKITSMVLGQFLTAIRDVYSRWGSGEWAKRIAGDRAEYYAAKQLRIERMLKAAEH